MPDATFATPDVTTFCRLDEVGLVVVGQKLEPDRAVLACRVADGPEVLGRWCRRCGSEGRARDTVTRRLAHEPPGWRPTTLLVTIRRYKRTGCGHVWRQDTAAWPNRARSCPGPPCGGRWSGSSASTCPSPVSPTSASTQTPTLRPLPRATGSAARIGDT